MTATAPPRDRASANPQPPAAPLAPRLWQRVLDSGWAFMLPFLAVFAAFMGWPVVYGFWLSLTDSTLIGTGGAFVGLANYAEALADPLMWQTLGNTVFFTLASTVPLVVVALAMAMLVHSGLPGQWLWRLSFFAPYLLPVATIALVGQFLFNQDIGVLNQATGANVGWLSDDSMALWSIVIATVWWTVGFNFLLYLAALQSIPDHLYEAASIDGAGAWARLWSITLPQLSRITGVVLVLQLLSSLKVFDQIYLLMDNNPTDATRSILIYVYDTGFTGYRLGYGSALSYIFLAIVVAVALLQTWVSSRRKGASA